MRRLWPQASGRRLMIGVDGRVPELAQPAGRRGRWLGHAAEAPGDVDGSSEGRPEPPPPQQAARSASEAGRHRQEAGRVMLER